MAKRMVYDCDACDAKALERVAHVGGVIGREMDAAGSMDDVCDGLDLCHSCCARQVQEMFRWLDPDQRATWLRNTRKR